MKTKPTLQRCLMIALGAVSILGLAHSARSATYTWRGTNSTTWGTAGNWLALSVGPTGTGGIGHRLDVNNQTRSELVYDASLGTTIYGTAGIRGIAIGSGAANAGVGTMTITGGSFITTNNNGGDVLGNGDNNTGVLNINGGTFVSGSTVFAMGLGGGANRTSTLNVNSGSATAGSISINTLRGTINLNGGTLAASNIVVSAVSGVNATNNFNGGTLQARGSTTGFFPTVASAVSRAQVRNGGAVIDTAGFNITMAQPLIHSTISGDAATDGGLTKNGNGTLTLNGTNTYTGPTVVNQGSLVISVTNPCTGPMVVNQGSVSMKLPSYRSSLTLGDSATASLTVSDSSWTTTSVNVTNATINLAFGNVVALPASIIPTTTLNASGSTVINITSGAGLPIGETKLIDHGGNKFGGGTFTLGTLPSGMQAGLVDGATAVSLVVTSSVQALVWSGTVNNEWATNGLLNWNAGASAYQEYISGFGDTVTFNDAAGIFYTVNVTNDVKPLDMIVSIPTAAVTISGSGKIAGSTGLTKSGAGALTMVSANSYDGVTTISDGTLQLNNGQALGSTNGGTVLTNLGVLLVGDASSTGITVADETVTIAHAASDANRSKGSLRGTDSGDNIWAGTVKIAVSGARIGTADYGKITVSGQITDSGSNYLVIFRPGVNGTVIVSGTNNQYGQTQTYGDGSASGVIRIGASNAFSTNALGLGLGFVDLNGYNQTLGGIYDASGPGTVKNDGASPSTLTINTGTNTFSSVGSIVDGSGTISLVKLGTGTQTLSSATLTYSGTTAVSEGRLNLGTASMNSSITVSGGATLSGEPTTTGSLTLDANSALIVDPSTANSLTANTISAATGPITVTFSGGFSGDALVLSAPGGITGSAANFQSVGGRGGSFYLTNANTQLYFSPAVASLVWKGNDPVNPTFWDTVTTNWLNGVNPDAFVSSDNVLFDDSASTFVVAPQGTVIASAVTFNNSISNYTVSGVIGSGTITKSGTATLTLTGNNTYSGITTINNGILVAGNANALGAKSGGTTITGSGTLNVNGLALGAEVISISGSGFGGNGTIVNTAADQINAVQRLILTGNASVGGSTRWDIRGVGSYLDMGAGYTLTKKGTNYIALVDTLLTNTPGNIVVEGGTFAIQTGTIIGGSAANTLTLQSGSILNNFNTTNTQPWSLVMENNTTYQANNGIVSHNVWSGPVTLNGAATLEVNAFVTISGNISGVGSATKTGTGTAILSGNNTYGGNTTVSVGTLVVDGTLSTGSVSVAANATLGGAGTIGGTVTVNGSGKIAPGNAGIGILTVATLSLSNSATANFEIQDSSTLDKVAVSSAGGLSFGTCGINLYVPGTTTAFSTDGTYTLFTYSGTLNGSLSDLTVANPVAGKTYVFTTTATEVQVTIGTAPTPAYWGVDSDGSWATSGNWNPTTVPNLQFASVNVGGPGSPVSFTAPHTITLDSTNTLGALILDTAQPFTINQGTSGNLQFDNGAAAGLITETTGSHTINAPLAVGVKGVAVSVASGTTISINGAMSGSGGLSLSGAGTNVLGGVSTYTGNTVINAGTLLVSNNAALGSTAGSTTVNSGTTPNIATVVLANGVTVTGETITINGYGYNVRGSLQPAIGATAEWAGPVKLGAGGNLDNNRVGAPANGTLKISGPITNGTISDLYISADIANGKVIVSGANTFSGKVGIIRGILELGANNSLPATALLDVHNASSVGDLSTFEMAGYNQTVAGIVRNGNGGGSLVTNTGSAATLTINTTNNYTYPGYMGGAITLVKEGSGTQALTIPTTYTGNTIVNGGTLAFSNATLDTNSTVSVTNNAVLQLNFTTTNQVAALVLNGTNQPAGVYNSITAAPYITGTGSLVILSAEPPSLTVTNIGSNLQITFAGGTLEAQTNSLSEGLGTNWVTYPGTSPVTITNDPANGSVFFRVKQ